MSKLVSVYSTLTDNKTWSVKNSFANIFFSRIHIFCNSPSDSWFNLKHIISVYLLVTVEMHTSYSRRVAIQRVFKLYTARCPWCLRSTLLFADPPLLAGFPLPSPLGVAGVALRRHRHKGRICKQTHVSNSAILEAGLKRSQVRIPQEANNFF